LTYNGLGITGRTRTLFLAGHQLTVNCERLVKLGEAIGTFESPKTYLFDLFVFLFDLFWYLMAADGALNRVLERTRNNIDRELCRPSAAAIC
jgi:hypothetical protein